MRCPAKDDPAKGLEALIRSLKKQKCSAKWDWQKILDAIQSGNQCGSGFWSLLEAGVYHTLHCTSGNKSSTITCKRLHTSDIRLMNYAGFCFSRLMLVSSAGKRPGKFKELLQAAVSTLMDSAFKAFEASDFPPSALQSFKISDSKILTCLVPLDSVSSNDRFGLSLCRIYVISSALRSIFEYGSASVLPLCLPYICSVVSTIYSINACDARHYSPILLNSLRHLLHSFCIVVQSCGINISPAAPVVMTTLVYQLEWASQFARSDPSRDSLTYKLAIYRCLSSLLEATAQMAFSVLSRVVVRIISEICFDMSYAASDSMSYFFTASEGAEIHKLHICCSFASLHLVELLFVNHPFILSRSLAKVTDPSYASSDTCAHKFKQCLLSLSSEFHRLASRLVTLLNKANKLMPAEQVFVRPHFLIALLNAMAAVRDYGFLFSRSNSLHTLSKILLKHGDSSVRLNAERCYRHTFKPISQALLVESDLRDIELTSSFTQTDQPHDPPSIEPEAGDTSSKLVQEIRHSAAPNETLAPDSPVTTVQVETEVAITETSFQEMDKLPAPCSVQLGNENPAPEKRPKKRVRFEEPEIPTKKIHPATMIQNAGVGQEPPTDTRSQGPNTSGTVCDETTMVRDALSTFDDTLI